MRKHWACRLGLIATSIVCFLASVTTVRASSTINLTGVVTCASGRPPVGIWVNSAQGGSKWATRYGVQGATSKNVYRVTLTVPALPTGIRLDIGCGGNPADWASNNRSAAVSVSSSRLLSAKCADPSTGVSQSCSWTSSTEVAPGGRTAARWALNRVGQSSSSGTTSTGRWSGWCAKFVGMAWGRTNAGYNSAIDMYRAWKNAGLIKSSGMTIGAPVFWNLSQYGHTGVYVGDGVVVSTQGYESDNKPVRAHTVGYLSSYLGWATPPSAWRLR